MECVALVNLTSFKNNCRKNYVALEAYCLVGLREDMARGHNKPTHDKISRRRVHTQFSRETVRHPHIVLAGASVPAEQARQPLADTVEQLFLPPTCMQFQQAASQLGHLLRLQRVRAMQTEIQLVAEAA